MQVSAITTTASPREELLGILTPISDQLPIRGVFFAVPPMDFSMAFCDETHVKTSCGITLLALRKLFGKNDEATSMILDANSTKGRLRTLFRKNYLRFLSSENSQTENSPILVVYEFLHLASYSEPEQKTSSGELQPFTGHAYCVIQYKEADAFRYLFLQSYVLEYSFKEDLERKPLDLSQNQFDRFHRLLFSMSQPKTSQESFFSFVEDYFRIPTTQKKIYPLQKPLMTTVCCWESRISEVAARSLEITKEPIPRALKINTSDVLASYLRRAAEQPNSRGISVYSIQTHTCHLFNLSSVSDVANQLFANQQARSSSYLLDNSPFRASPSP